MNRIGLVRIREGSTELVVPQEFCRKGPGTDTGEVFYNRQMEFSRDVSVMFGRSFFSDEDRVLDGLAATGARGVRIANECDTDAEVHINDRSSGAVDLVVRNLELNGIRDAVVHNRDLRALLAEERFSYIDIDPFGTPVPFIDAAVQSCRDGGIVAVTATDTAPLHGAYPRTSERRYGAVSMRCPFSHETGLRILVGHIAREAAKHDRGCTPLLCYHADHYFRCYVRLRKGAARADDSVGAMGYAVYDASTGDRRISTERPEEGARSAGPLWTGGLVDRAAAASLTAAGDLATPRRCLKALDLWVEEADAPALYHTVDELARATKCSPPRMSELILHLGDQGVAASRTHFDPRGVKVRASFGELADLFRSCARDTRPRH